MPIVINLTRNIWNKTAIRQNIFLLSIFGFQDVDVNTEAAIVPSCGRCVTAVLNNVCSDTTGKLGSPVHVKTGKGLPGSMYVILGRDRGRNCVLTINSKIY